MAASPKRPFVSFLEDRLPPELVFKIFSYIDALEDRCNFHMSCTATRDNDQINALLCKRFISCGAPAAVSPTAAPEQAPAWKDAVMQLAGTKRAMKELVLCSRMPRSRQQLRVHHNPRDPGLLLSHMADACAALDAAKCHLVRLSVLTLQGWVLGSTPNDLGNFFVKCPRLQELKFLGCTIMPGMEVLSAIPPLASQLQSLSLHACTFHARDTLAFVGNLTALTALTLRVSGTHRRPWREQLECDSSEVDLTALSTLVNLRTLTCGCDEIAASGPACSWVTQESLHGPTRCCGFTTIARTCTQLTHLEFGFGCLFERPAPAEAGEIIHPNAHTHPNQLPATAAAATAAAAAAPPPPPPLPMYPSLTTLALPCAVPRAMLELMRPATHLTQLQGEVGIRLPARLTQAPFLSYMYHNGHHLTQHAQHIQQLLQQLLQPLQPAPAPPAQQQQQQHGEGAPPAQPAIAQGVLERLARDFLHAPNTGSSLRAAAELIAARAPPGAAARRLSLKPLRDPNLPGRRLCDAGFHLRALAPLKDHVQHLCLGRMFLCLDSDARALVTALPELRSLRLEDCTLKRSVPRHLDAQGEEQPGQDGGLAQIMTGLTHLTRLDLIGGCVDGQDVLDAAAQASSMVAASHMRGRSLPQIHLTCIGVEGMERGWWMQEWQLRQEAYQTFEGELMRVVLDVREEV